MGIDLGPPPELGIQVQRATQDVLVCLTAGEEFYSKAIRNLTHSDVNHALIAYKSREWGGWWAVQTDERGVVKVPVENVKYNYIECYEFPQLDLKSAMPRIRDLVGDRYDWLGIAGFMVKLWAWRLFGRRVVNPLHKEGDLFCSEMVTRFLKQVDGMYGWMMALKPSSVAPGGSPKYLGAPSLQWEFENHPDEEVRKVLCPF